MVVFRMFHRLGQLFEPGTANILISFYRYRSIKFLFLFKRFIAIIMINYNYRKGSGNKR